MRRDQRGIGFMRGLLCITLAATASVVYGQSGIGLAIEQAMKANTYNVSGTLVIITVKDGKYVSHKMGARGAISPRFSPDGSEFVYLAGGKCIVADPTGKTKRSWSAKGGQVTWGKTSIWVHTGGSSFAKYDPATGKGTGKINCGAGLKKGGRISAAENAAAAFTSNGNKVGVKSGSNWKGVYIGLSKTCSMCPSPSGKLFTANLWEKGAQHRAMEIRNSSGKRVKKFYMFDILPVLKGKNFAWNAQMWTGHHEDWILLPCGQGKNQWEKSAIPFLYNINTGKSVMMAPDLMMKKMWAPYDFYINAGGPSTSNPDTTSNTDTTSTPEPSGLDFSKHVKLSFGGASDGWEDGDQFVSGGEAFTFSGSATTDGVTDPAPAAVYNSVNHRGGSTDDLVISLPDVADGSYKLRFHVTDMYGGRAMDILAEGNMVVENLDPMTEGGGAMAAVVKEATVTVSDGNGLEIRLTDDRTEPKDVFLSGMEIIPQGTTTPVLPARIMRKAAPRASDMQFDAAGKIRSATARHPGSVIIDRAGQRKVLKSAQ